MHIESPSKHNQTNSNYNWNTTFKLLIKRNGLHAAKDFEKVLKISGYYIKITCKRKINWFNQPFSKTVSTKTGHYFLNLLDKNFPKIVHFTVFSTKITSPEAKAVPKTKKKNIITNNSKMIFNKSETLNKKKWNCINKNTCPLNGKCQA